MKTKEVKPKAPVRTPKKPTGAFATEAAFLATKQQQFQAVFGQVDWEMAKS